MNEEMPMPDDIYHDLPDDLLAALRDPRTVLPGEYTLYERVVSWTMTPVVANPNQPSSAWIEIKPGQPLTGVDPSRVAL
jgi:hypothetical protein